MDHLRILEEARAEALKGDSSVSGLLARLPSETLFATAAVALHYSRKKASNPTRSMLAREHAPVVAEATPARRSAPSANLAQSSRGARHPSRGQRERAARSWL